MKMTTVNLFVRKCFDCPCYIEYEDQEEDFTYKYCGLEQTLGTPSVFFIFNGNIPEKCPLRSINTVTIQLEDGIAQ